MGGGDDDDDGGSVDGGSAGGGSVDGGSGGGGNGGDPAVPTAFTPPFHWPLNDVSGVALVVVV